MLATVHVYVYLYLCIYLVLQGNFIFFPKIFVYDVSDQVVMIPEEMHTNQSINQHYLCVLIHEYTRIPTHIHSKNFDLAVLTL